MYKVTLSILFMVFAVQQVTLAQTLPTNTEFYKKKELNIKLEDFNGSKYLDNDFQLGVISDNLSKKTFQAYVRYDVLNDVFEIKESLSQSATTFLNKASATSVKINNSEFTYASYLAEDSSRKLGYIESLGSILEGTLYARYEADLRLPQKAKTTLEKNRKGKISIKEYYMLKDENSIKLIKVNKKSIFDLFPKSHSQKLKVFLKENKNKVRNASEIKAIIDFSNSL
ncbi:hypothetical protein [Dokdonia sp. PRO95]|uniref:hypothetical protein n=1 Tax=Dokdonia sp. PRO95 TaxID=1239415 RepID=UPI000552F9C1|nr:hypothetical protein [Dokdonia sp. PRO95]